jgi:FkbM family methyltransferase
MEQVQVCIADRTFTVHESERSGWDNLATGVREPCTVEALSRLTDGDVFIDIGAYIGATALIAASHGATVVAFEPDPVASAELEANVAANPDFSVAVHRVALSDRSGTRQLTAPYVLGDSMSSIARKSRAKASNRAVEVTVDDVRKWLPEFGAARLVKMDVEGGEYRLLPAMRPWLTQQHPDLLLSLHTYHLSGVVNRLPKILRKAAWRATAVTLRARLHWLGSLYVSRQIATKEGWKPLSRQEFRQRLNQPGEFELLLSHTPPGASSRPGSAGPEAQPNRLV